MAIPAFLISMGVVGIGVLCFALFIGFPQLNTPQRNSNSYTNEGPRYTENRRSSNREWSGSRDKSFYGHCPICQEEICDEQRNAKRTLCGHRFHSYCLDHWLRHSKTCPTCRSPV